MAALAPSGADGESANGSVLQEQADSLLGIKLSDRQIGQFEDLTGLLLAWNQRMNLTGITDPSDIFIKHYLDSLTPARVIPRFDGSGSSTSARAPASRALRWRSPFPICT